MKIKVTEENVKKLMAYRTIGANGREERFSRWTAEGKDRLYINNSVFGLREWYSKSTGFHHAEIEGLSRTESRKYIGCKNYIDLADGTVVSTNYVCWSCNFKNEFCDLVGKILAED